MEVAMNKDNDLEKLLFLFSIVVVITILFLVFIVPKKYRVPAKAPGSFTMLNTKGAGIPCAFLFF